MAIRIDVFETVQPLWYRSPPLCKWRRIIFTNEILPVETSDPVFCGLLRAAFGLGSGLPLVHGPVCVCQCLEWSVRLGELYPSAVHFSTKYLFMWNQWVPHLRSILKVHLHKSPLQQVTGSQDNPHCNICHARYKADQGNKSNLR